MSQIQTANEWSTILVPLANPKTASTLLQLSLALIDPPHGKVIALVVSLGDIEAQAESIEEIETIIAGFQEQNQHVELRTHNSTSIARGILDTAHEMGADVIVMGLNHPTGGRFSLDTIVENVLAAALCDVMMYRAGRSGHHGAKFQRIVVPTDGSKDAAAACKIALRLSEAFQVKVEAMYAQPHYEPRWKGLGRIAESLEGIPGHEHVIRTLINAHEPAEGLLARIQDDDLLIIGHLDRPTFEGWLFGDFFRSLLTQAHGPLLITNPYAHRTPLGSGTWRYLNRFRVRLTPVEQEDVMRQVYDQATLNLDFVMLILISAVLASLGLLLNNTSVIIGAMLVAPVMQPCVAFAVGLTTSQYQLVRRALTTLAIAIPLALLVAVAVSVLIPIHSLTSEMLSRTQPTLLDAAVALASGVIGGYALVRKDIPSALAGVAIAAALMPPLCTVGLSVAFGQSELGFQAALLFLTNIACIILASWAVFVAVGMRGSGEKSSQQNRVFWLAIVAGLFIITSVILGSANSVANKVRIAQNQIQQSFGDSQVISVAILPDNNLLHVQATIRTTRVISSDQVKGIEQLLAEQLHEPVQLEIGVVPVVTAQTGDVSSP
ncbi:MAG: TIGR00341 family protein [Chloroflexota bacterium]